MSLKRSNDPAALLEAAQKAQAAGDNAGAVKAYDRLVRLAPHIAELHNNRGVALRALGRMVDARKAFMEAVRRRPDYADALSNLGSLQNAAGESLKAVETLMKAAALSPSDSEILVNLGNAQATSGDRAAAHKAFRDAAVGNRPEKGLSAEGRLLLDEGRTDEAIEVFSKLVAGDPRDIQALVDLSAALFAKGDLDAVGATLEQAPDIASENPRFIAAHGVLRSKQGRFEEAIRLLEEAIRIEPANPDLNYQLAGVHRAAGDPDQSISILDEALKRHHDHPELVNMLWLNCLYTGDFRRGWRLREKRWNSRHITSSRNDRGQKPWNQNLPRNRVVRVWGEQGIGDEAMFARDLGPFIELGWPVLLECDPRLHSLIRRRFPDLQIIGNGDSAGDQADCQLPIGSLPSALYPDRQPDPSTGPHFIADSGKTPKYADWLSSLPGSVKVGVSWKSRNPDMGPDKSMDPSLFGVLAEIPGVDLVNLQYGECSAELAMFNERTGRVIHEHPDLDRFSDMDGLAALIAGLDCVISTSNTTVHLAGGLGKPVQVMVPHAADWRWFRDMKQSPWYPDVSVYRQPEPGDWESVVHAVKADFHSRFMA
jgi:Flp pilus assembly protein TadD